ncbi:23S rRNA (uracil747-C5)-methyltransferase [Marmoricola sp. OAE513]|uniref:23S rRNA (uracil(747)-C(5))-methyltransferase RlmC n=1 Tax=Marmoricola sp. OAE513 TaxID=2817894 RepID=UPI001AE91277
MDCRHFEASTCRSCSWLPTPYADQVTAKQRRCAEALAAHPGVVWAAPFTGQESGFRNKAKMVVSGTVEAPVLGITGPDGGVDLVDCGLHVTAVASALPVLAEFVTRARLEPYDVRSRRGELKYLLVTGAPDGALMVRFVCRSQEPVTRLRKHLPWLTDALPSLRVASVNLQPEPKAVLEGDVEIVLTEHDELTMTLNDVELALRPQSFFQTNTEVAAALYREARSWVEDSGASTVWDLYSGVGGFALHLARQDRDVVGIEVSAEAVLSAQETARRTGARARFEVGDAASYAARSGAVPDLVVVNPPRRGIGGDLAGWLENSSVALVLYSSCNPESLSADLAAMPSLRPVRGRLFDMFPQTAHAEVLVLLERAPATAAR